MTIFSFGSFNNKVWRRSNMQWMKIVVLDTTLSGKAIHLQEYYFAHYSKIYSCSKCPGSARMFGSQLTIYSIMLTRALGAAFGANMVDIERELTLWFVRSRYCPGATSQKYSSFRGAWEIMFAGGRPSTSHIFPTWSCSFWPWNNG